jgi:Zn-dependent protease
MSRQNIPLGRILGIRIGLDYSWFLVFALLTWLLAQGYYPVEFKNWPSPLYWFMGVLTAIMLFVSVLLHELGHSLVALRYKMPVRSITLFIFGGVAQIGAEPPSAIAEFLIAVAGPVVSLTLAAFFNAVQPLVSGVQPLVGLIKYLAYINLALVVFNLIPGFPLDGGRVFRAIVWALTKNMRRATLIAASVGRFFGLLFIFLGVLKVFAGNIGDGLWIALIGFFLDNAASAQVQQVMFSGSAGRPQGFAGDEQSVPRCSWGSDAAAVSGRTCFNRQPALFFGYPRSGHRWPDDFASDQRGAPSRMGDDECRRGHASLGTVETNRPRHGTMDRSPTDGPRWSQSVASHEG